MAPRIVIDAIHCDQLREHGGLPGVRDESALESALARAATDVALRCPDGGGRLCLPLGEGPLVSRRNKRIGFLAMVTCLGINGYEFDAPDGEVVAEFLALAERRVSENALTDWIRQLAVRAR